MKKKSAKRLLLVICDDKKKSEWIFFGRPWVFSQPPHFQIDLDHSEVVNKIEFRIFWVSESQILLACCIISIF